MPPKVQNTLSSSRLSLRYAQPKTLSRHKIAIAIRVHENPLVSEVQNREKEGNNNIKRKKIK